MRNRSLLLMTFFIALVSCQPELHEDVQTAYEALPEVLDFNIHVKPILSDKCFACHGPDKAKQQAGLRLDLREVAIAELPQNPGHRAIVPGNLAKSELFHRIMSEDPDMVMPTKGSNLQLTDYEKAVLVKWIEQGAEYKPHWSFTKPVKKNPPKTNSSWVKSPIDKFVLQKLKENNLSPSPEAPREILLRRLSLDLTGLPPTLGEIIQFIDDRSPDAYEKQVDRLLNSPHYGERMATDWLDLSRFADTYGYQVDRYRDMSPWRDWVINAFNKNMPYDEFVKWQLAGDLMPKSTKEMLIATGFNRLHPQNMEDGIVDEEFRVENVSDRTAVVGQGLMAMTVACAKCHDHKFDPISQKEYYQLFAFFNNINETGQISWDPKDIPVPNMLLTSARQDSIISFLQRQTHEGELKLDSVKKSEQPRFKQWLDAGGYLKINRAILRQGKIADFNFERTLRNAIAPGKQARMDREFVPGEVPEFAEGKTGSGLLFNGDAWLDADPIGIFKRDQSFSIGLWLNIPKALTEGVIFHKNQGTMLHAYKGYHLYMKDDKLEVMFAHTWPDNAIVKHSVATIPKDEWIHLMLTYDGSSKARGVRLYLNGEEMQTTVVIDNLYKDIIFHNLVDQIYPKPIEPALQVGARWRGKGIAGAAIDDLVVYNRELSSIEVRMIRAEQTGILSKDPSELTTEDKYHLEDFYFRHFSSQYKQFLSELSRNRRVLADSIEDVREVMVMKEMKTVRPTFVLERGLYNALGERVAPSTPESILPWNKEYQRNRLGLANWFFSPDHPLTARVAVNRYWQMFFGRGLVSTTEDFGNQGELPSHPELLDWLAVKFRESGWDVKALHKLIVTSATYRQRSEASEALLENDPKNILLARGPKSRLTSEMMRDNALAASGLLNRKIGGRSIKPYQPEGLWTMNADTYVQDEGENVYKRSLYVYWKRTVPHPTLSTFDQPERTECTVRRQKTNTPLQALALLNDPAFVEVCKVIGEQITREEDPNKGVIVAYRKLTGVTPDAKIVRLLLDLRQSEHKKFKADREKVKGWLSAGQYRIDKTLSSDLVAANAVVASAILNSDACITKR